MPEMLIYVKLCESKTFGRCILNSSGWPCHNNCMFNKIICYRNAKTSYKRPKSFKNFVEFFKNSEIRVQERVNMVASKQRYFKESTLSSENYFLIRKITCF